MTDAEPSEKARRKAARALVGRYHEEQLAALLERVRGGFARYDAGELDAFELDDLIHHFKRSTQELWKFCVVTGGRVEAVARTIDDLRERGEPADWWEAGRPRRGRQSE